jgi:hypothetical protein
MRGRVVAGAYKQMGLVDAPIADQLSNYANIAIDLGCDPEKRLYLKEYFQNASIPGVIARPRIGHFLCKSTNNQHCNAGKQSTKNTVFYRCLARYQPREPVCVPWQSFP